MWTVECSDNGKEIKEVVKVAGKIEAYLSRSVLSAKYKYVDAYDEDGDYVDEVEL